LTWASKIDAAGDRADIAETIENHWFSMVFEGWGVDSGGLEGSWLSFWGDGWLNGGWLRAGWC
jgi:pantothenate kinase-related protein Tda10